MAITHDRPPGKVAHTQLTMDFVHPGKRHYYGDHGSYDLSPSISSRISTAVWTIST